jgi:hypothetical protein
MTWDSGVLASCLDGARRSQFELLGIAKAVEQTVAVEAAASAMAQEVVSNSAIEGVSLDRLFRWHRTDLALAQDERLQRRFYSLSVQIMRAKQDYYAALEQAQRGGLDVTDWLLWFLRQVHSAARDGVREVGLVLARSCFWERAKGCGLNDRQERVLGNLLAPGSQDLAVSNRRYRAITKASRATASRDLAELARLGLVVPCGESRSASYRIDLDRFLPEAFRAEPG